jgi:arylsulfatase A-like enzyme
MSEPASPNILFIMSDDHAAHAIGAYGSVINRTPHLDRIGREGVVLENCFCTNSICAPSRGTILTGTHSHVNGVRTLDDLFDGRQETVQALMRDAGYQTAIVGKWHLGHGGHADPTGFDYWAILPGQGAYHNPDMYVMGQQTKFDGYATDIITDLSLDWLGARDRDRPFLLFLHHKAPHRNWEPDERHARMYDEVEIPYPATFDDDYENRSRAAREAKMRIDRDLTAFDVKQAPPEGLSAAELKKWKYQRYIKDYLACVASVDDNVGRVLDYLDAEGIADDTIVIYTSDQGFFLGDHGWFDKRFMYEESLRMPFLMRYQREIPAGERHDAMVTNVDFAPTFLDYAGLPPSDRMQGRSFRAIVGGEPEPDNWPEGMYYRYWMHRDSEHNTTAHYGIRTRRHKLIFYYGDPLDAAGAHGPATDPEWELFDLQMDPLEMRNVYDDPAYAAVVRELTDELHRLQAESGDTRYIPAEV